MAEANYEGFTGNVIREYDLSDPNDVPVLPEVDGNIVQRILLAEDFFAFIVVPPVTYFRNIQTRSKGYLRQDSFLQVTATRKEAEEIQTRLKNDYGVDTFIIPLTINFKDNTQVTLSLRRLIDVEARTENPAPGQVLLYDGNTIELDDGTDTFQRPFFEFSRLNTSYIDEDSTKLYYTDQRVKDFINDPSSLVNHLSTPTPDETDNSTKIATTAYVRTAIENLIDDAPTTLDTLNEIAEALNNDDDAFNTLLSINSNIQAELDRTQIGAGLTNDDIPNPAYDPETNPDVPQFLSPLISGNYQTKEDSNYLKSQDFTNATLSANLFNADILLDSAVNNLQTELNTTQSSVGLGEDGSLGAFSSTTFLSSSMGVIDTIKSAVETLDTALNFHIESGSVQNTTDLGTLTYAVGSGDYLGRGVFTYTPPNLLFRGNGTPSGANIDGKVERLPQSKSGPKFQYTPPLLDVTVATASGAGNLVRNTESTSTHGFTYTPPDHDKYNYWTISADNRETAGTNNITSTEEIKILGGDSIETNLGSDNITIDIVDNSIGFTELGISNSETPDNTFLKHTTDGNLEFSSITTTQIQADWNESVTTSAAYINNKPTIAQADWNESVTTSAAYINNKPDLTNYLTEITAATPNELGGVKIYFDDTSSILYISSSESIPTQDD